MAVIVIHNQRKHKVSQKIHPVHYLNRLRSFDTIHTAPSKTALPAILEAKSLPKEPCFSILSSRVLMARRFFLLGLADKEITFLVSQTLGELHQHITMKVIHHNP